MADEIPVWLESSLSSQDLARIDSAVKTAEARTSAEIVPMIVHRSTLKATGDRILFWICFGILGIGGAVSLSLMGALDDALLDSVIGSMGLWPTANMHLVLSAVAEVLVALAAFGFAWVVSKGLSTLDAAHRFVFPDDDLVLETEHRAQTEFFSSDLRATSGRTGVLLFVSMLERRAVILTDKSIAEKFDHETWKKTLAVLLQAIGQGKMGEGYAQAIESIGQMLAPHFPLQPDDINELSDGLRIHE